MHVWEEKGLSNQISRCPLKQVFRLIQVDRFNGFVNLTVVRLRLVLPSLVG